MERSANVFDLSFVPDEMTFDDEFRYAAFIYILAAGGLTRRFSDEATEDVNAPYKPVEFVTDVSLN